MNLVDFLNQNGPTDSVDEALFLTDDEACAFERKRALELKLIDRTTFEVME
jgi:hypothetical protein